MKHNKLRKKKKKEKKKSSAVRFEPTLAKKKLYEVLQVSISTHWAIGTSWNFYKV